MSSSSSAVPVKLPEPKVCQQCQTPKPRVDYLSISPNVCRSCFLKNRASGVLPPVPSIPPTHKLDDTKVGPPTQLEEDVVAIKKWLGVVHQRLSGLMAMSGMGITIPPPPQ